MTTGFKQVDLSPARIKRSIEWRVSQYIDEPLKRRIHQLAEKRVRILAKILARTPPLALYPGWHFGIEEEGKPRRRIQYRLEVWRYFRSREIQVPIQMKWHNDIRIHSYLGNDLSRCVYVGGHFDPNELSLLDRVLCPGDVFVDGGANEGLYTLFASAKVGNSGRVLAIEPSLREFNRLLANIRLNEMQNVSPMRCALGNNPGRALLSVAQEEHSGQSTLLQNAPEHRDSGHEHVEVINLDSLVQAEGTSDVSAVKLDIEGAEGMALEGSHRVLQTFRPLLLIEINRRALWKQGASAEEIFTLLRRAGYDAYCFDQASGRPSRMDSAPSRDGNLLAVHHLRKPKDL